MKRYQKIIACVLAVVLSAGSTGAIAYNSHRNASAMEDTAAITDSLQSEDTAAEADAAERVAENDRTFKDETVYVLCNSNATPREVIVSDWLKNPQALKNLPDKSNLTNIENVKGDEGYTPNAGGMNWAANGADIYYRGNSNKSLPVDVSLTYTLDGQRVSADAIKGKSGHLVMEWTYRNNTAVRKTIAGESRTVCVPFMAASTAILNSDVFSNVKVTNGRVLSDGEKLIIVGTAFPGLESSLGLREIDKIDVEIPDSFQIECDVKDFQMDSSVTVVSNQIFNEIELDKAADIDDLEDKLNQLNDAAGDLCDGTTKLYNGICELSDGTDDLGSGVQKLVNGASDLHDGANTLADGAQKLADGTKTAADGMTVLYDGIVSAKGGSATLFGSFSKVQDGSSALVSGIRAARDGAMKIDDGLGKVCDGSGKLVKGYAQVTDGAAKLGTGIDSAKDGAQQLQDGIAQAADGSASLTDGFTQVSDGAAKLDAGIGSAKDGAEKSPRNYRQASHRQRTALLSSPAASHR